MRNSGYRFRIRATGTHRSNTYFIQTEKVRHENGTGVVGSYMHLQKLIPTMIIGVREEARETAFQPTQIDSNDFQ